MPRSVVPLALAMVVGWQLPALAQSPYLVKDINSEPIPAGFTGPTSVDDVAFLTVEEIDLTGESKFELWKSDGSVAGTELVHILCLSRCSYAPNPVLGVGGQLFFSFPDRLSGC